MAAKKGAISKFQKKRKKLNRSKVMILAAVLVVIAYFVFSGIKILHLNTEKAKVEEKNRQLKEEIENLNQQLEAINSPEFIERLARRNLKLVKQGELMFVLPNLRESEEATGSADGEDNAAGEESSSKADNEAANDDAKNSAEPESSESENGE